jgi:hypothetical protein
VSKAERTGEDEPAGGVARSPFPFAAGLLFGVGLGGFFDGIVLHQLLQWHHMLSSWYPINSLDNLKLNTRWDGAFHSLTYLFVLGGLVVLWTFQCHRRTRRPPASWHSPRQRNRNQSQPVGMGRGVSRLGRPDDSGRLVAVASGQS